MFYNPYKKYNPMCKNKKGGKKFERKKKTKGTIRKWQKMREWINNIKSVENMI